jgi:hypothetical protein
VGFDFLHRFEGKTVSNLALKTLFDADIIDVKEGYTNAI